MQRSPRRCARRRHARPRSSAGCLSIASSSRASRNPTDRREAPRTKEQKFAAALNAGNPEVAGGKIRHGMFYDGGVYWAPEPLSFIYYNIVNRFKD